MSDDSVIRRGVTAWQENAENIERQATLQHGGGGGTSGGMDIIDAKIAAAEARTDTKFAEVLGELKAMRSDMSHMPSTWAMVGTMGGFAVVIVTVILAVMAYGGDRFDGGVAFGQGSAEAKVALDKVTSENAAQTKQIEQLSGQLNQVLMAIQPKDGGQSQFKTTPYATPKP